MPFVYRWSYSCANLICMAVNGSNSAATHFGRQMRKERLAHGWSLRELSERTGVDFGTLSRVENGRRPPTENLAKACDRVFQERRGWFQDWYDESRTWSEVPAGFRSWAEVEEKAASLHVWMPGIIHGLLQTEEYARALLATSPGVAPETVAARLASRMERQRRVLERDTPPAAWFVVDEMALYRCVGSPEAMAEQMCRLAEMAATVNVTITVMPPIAHPGNESGWVIADGAAYAEHAAGGYVFTDEQTVTPLATRFDSLRGESYRVSESLARIERMTEVWARGARAATAGQTAEIA